MLHIPEFAAYFMFAFKDVTEAYIGCIESADPSVSASRVFLIFLMFFMYLAKSFFFYSGPDSRSLCLLTPTRLMEYRTYPPSRLPPRLS